MEHSPLRISTPDKEGVMQTSKWLKHAALLSSEEMKNLLLSLGSFLILDVSRVVSLEKAFITPEDFLEKYSDYVTSIQKNLPPQENIWRPYFSSIFTINTDKIYAMKVGENKFLIKALEPVVQLQMHYFLHSKVDKKFYSNVQSKDSVSWGIQFSYPQVYQRPHDQSYVRVDGKEGFPNSSLFHHLVKWLRLNTLPTPFLYEGKRNVVSFRIGKQSFTWAGLHSDLAREGLVLSTYPKNEAK